MDLNLEPILPPGKLDLGGKVVNIASRQRRLYQPSALTATGKSTKIDKLNEFINSGEESWPATTKTAEVWPAPCETNQIGVGGYCQSDVNDEQPW